MAIQLGVMLYLVLNEHQVTAFNFYLSGKIQQGIRHGTSLYGLAYSFDSDLRLAAYNFAQQLTESGCSVVLTVATNYKVWVCLNAAEYSHYQALKDASSPSEAIAG